MSRKINIGDMVTVSHPFYPDDIYLVLRVRREELGGSAIHMTKESGRDFEGWRPVCTREETRDQVLIASHDMEMMSWIDSQHVLTESDK